MLADLTTPIAGASEAGVVHVDEGEITTASSAVVPLAVAELAIPPAVTSAWAVV